MILVRRPPGSGRIVSRRLDLSDVMLVGAVLLVLALVAPVVLLAAWIVVGLVHVLLAIWPMLLTAALVVVAVIGIKADLERGW